MMQKEVNFGTVAKDYAKYRNDLPDVIFEQLAERGILLAGNRVADLGCGTGVLSRELAKRGAHVVGADPADNVLDEAREIDAHEGLTIEYVQAGAEDTGLPSHKFHLVTVLRSWHWFDRPRAIAEIKRLLQEPGYVVVMDSGINPQTSEVARATFDLIRKHAPNGVLQAPGSKAETKERKNGFPTNWFAEWEASGLHEIASWQFPYEVSFTHESWRGRVRSLSWVSTFDEATREKLDAELTSLLQEAHAAEALVIPHVYSTVILKWDGAEVDEFASHIAWSAHHASTD